MKAIAVVSNQINDFFSIDYVPAVNIQGTVVNLGCIEIEKPDFDKSISSNFRKVLVKVRAFSCNYRDKAIIVKHALKRQDFPCPGVAPFAFFGSDFVAEVVEVGSGVKTLQKGDRVIPDCSYPVAKDNSAAPGVVTNEASRGWLVLDEAKLMSIPDSMSDEIAAGFSIGGQTASSLVRRTVTSETKKVLVTSGRSNTSQFVSWFLRNQGVYCDLLSTSIWSKEELSAVEPCKVINVSRGSTWSDSIPSNSYDVIIDPFFDLHIDDSVRLLRTNGIYITCGYKNQHKTFGDETDDMLKLDLHNVMIQTMIKNISIVGNCIGYSKDLELAVSLFESSQIPPMPVDGTYSPLLANEFLNRTYNSSTRLGKAVMKYI